MVIDTDVLIWYMRGNEKAYQLIENSNNFFISVHYLHGAGPGIEKQTGVKQVP
jgi:hypothetical protein